MNYIFEFNVFHLWVFAASFDVHLVVDEAESK